MSAAMMPGTEAVLSSITLERLSLQGEIHGYQQDTLAISTTAGSGYAYNGTGSMNVSTHTEVKQNSNFWVREAGGQDVLLKFEGHFPAASGQACVLDAVLAGSDESGRRMVLLGVLRFPAARRGFHLAGVGNRRDGFDMAVVGDDDVFVDKCMALLKDEAFKPARERLHVVARKTASPLHKLTQLAALVTVTGGWFVSRWVGWLGVALLVVMLIQLFRRSDANASDAAMAAVKDRALAWVRDLA